MNSFKKIKSLKGFKNLSFYSRDEQELLEAVRLLSKLDYRTIDGCFNTEEAVTHNGLCAWGDGEITEGWLVSNAGFTQVTLAELKDMVGEDKEVLWLNIETLEERVITDGKKFYSDVWVKVPDGATFATGDKDNFIFRKDGWYYDNQKGWWIKCSITFEDVHKHKLVTLLWVKGEYLWDVSDNKFTLERLIGCEVRFDHPYGVSAFGYITGIVADGYAFHVTFSSFCDLCSKDALMFFTEDGRELYFDEYVELYYPQG